MDDEAPAVVGALDGVRVVEFGMWVAGPAVGAVLADWGASVVKVEPLGGDPQRALAGVARTAEPGLPVNPSFDVTNRGKRSIALDLKSEEGREIALRLVAEADVVVTNMRPSALARLGLDHASLSARHPALIYGLLTGYGTEGPAKDAPGYDIGAYWSRSAIAASLTIPGGTPPFQRGAMGDRTAGAALAGGIAAALFARERTGRGQLVSASLFRWGVYTLSSDLSLALHHGRPMDTARRETMSSPTVNCYSAADGRWFWLTGLERDRHWPALVRAVDRPHWLTDPRYATAGARADNAADLIAELDAVFASAPRADWVTAFVKHDVWHEVLNTVPDLLDDEQLVPSGALAEVRDESGASTTMVNTPIDFTDTPSLPRASAPELGAHTDELLLELGYDHDHVAALRTAGRVV